MKNSAIILVTGANGFVGRYLVPELAKYYRVRALVRPGTIPGFRLSKGVEVVYGDMTKPESLTKIVPFRGMVVNLAVNPYHPTKSYEVNVRGLQTLLSLAKKNQVQKWIQISSQATKIKNKGVYGSTKAEADYLVKASKIPFVILKPSLIYGAGERGLFAKIQNMMRLTPVVPVFGSGENKVYPIRVEEVAKVIRVVMGDKSAKAEVWELGCTQGVSYNQLYRAIAGERQIKLLHVPVWLGLTLARGLQKIWQNPPVTVDNILGSTQATHCRPGGILHRYKLRPTEFAKGIQELHGFSKLRVAVVGLGKMGTLHLSLLSTFPQVKIAALVDTNKTLFNTIRSMGIGGKFYPNLTTAIEAEKLEAVYLITPTFTHLPLIKEALRAGLDVFVEKPLVLNREELKELLAIKTDRVVHVGYTMFFAPVFVKLEELVKSGQYGKIVWVKATFEHGEVFGPKKGWMFNKKFSGGGVLMNPGPHLFSVLSRLFGRPRKIEGVIKEKYQAGIDDEAMLRLSYPGFSAQVELSWSVPGKHTAQTNLEIECAGARIKTDGHQIEIRTKGKKTVIKEQQLVDPQVFDLNPQAYGAAYYLEDQAFVNAVKNRIVRAPNSLKRTASIDETIHRVYELAKVAK